MLKIDAQIVRDIRDAREAKDLHKHLQAAIELEHATIPPYLTALYSIKRGHNQEAYDIIRSVVKEEMLHMTIAANVLNAIGGRPEINKPDFVPDYPGPLPMNIGDGLIVGLQPLSKALVKNVFMHIEEPETPLVFPDQAASFAATEPDYSTIGEFYEAIIRKIKDLGSDIFTGDLRRQVVNEQWFSEEELFQVTGVEQAVAALKIIVEQGEGTPESPVDPEGDFAHYYRFEEIVKGRRLVKDDTVSEGYSFSGEPVPLDPEGIWDLVENSKSSLYAPGTSERRMADQFNYSYTNLLRTLHDTFDGKPDHLNRAIGLMYELKLQAQKMVEVTDPRQGKQVAPAFQYATINTEDSIR